MRVFLVVSFAFSWTIGLVVWGLGSDLHVLVRTLLLSVYMFGPAVGAVAAQRVAGASVVVDLQARLRTKRAWLAAWLAPVALQPLVIGFALLWPDVTWSPEFTGFLERLSSSLTPTQVAEASAQLQAIPRPAFVALLLAQALGAGISINAVAAFGEELGWRGYLYKQWAHLGFWRRALVVGAIWGVWHAPIILQGHNYPQHPVIGVGMMVVFCVLLAPLMDLARERGASVWAAAIMHGTVNASAGFGRRQDGADGVLHRVCQGHLVAVVQGPPQKGAHRGVDVKGAAKARREDAQAEAEAVDHLDAGEHVFAVAVVDAGEAETNGDVGLDERQERRRERQRRRSRGAEANVGVVVVDVHAEAGAARDAGPDAEGPTRASALISACTAVYGEEEEEAAESESTAHVQGWRRLV